MSGVLAPVSVVDESFIDSLSDAEIVSLRFDIDTWLRPEQRILRHDWRYYGFICGRGWGKTMTIAGEINRRVELGLAKHVGLMAPTEDRVEEVQIEGLIQSAPPWFRPERYRGGLLWPNGVTAIVFSPVTPGRSRSENLDLTWLTEIVDWQVTTRREAYENITTATRIGTAQVIWDTTSKGRNDVIEKLLELHEKDPVTYPLVRGEMFDNPLLGAKYLRSECDKYSGRRLDEEILGRVFRGAQGAMWQQSWIDKHRATEPPDNVEIIIIGVDPALTGDSTSDEVGVCVGARTVSGDAYILEDLTAHMTPDQWGELVIRECVDRRASGVAIERNHLGQTAVFVLRACARNYTQTHGTRLEIRVLAKDKPFPLRTPGVIYVREHVAATSKITRAEGPATATKQGKVHVFGTLPDLEYEWTTYAPGVTRSPNRYDASVYTLIELLSLADVHTPQARRNAVVGSGEANRKLANELRKIKGRGRVGL